MVTRTIEKYIPNKEIPYYLSPLISMANQRIAWNMIVVIPLMKNGSHVLEDIHD